MEQFNKVGGIIEMWNYPMQKTHQGTIFYPCVTQVNFWYQEYFHGVNLSSLRDSAMCEYFRQPIVSWTD